MPGNDLANYQSPEFQCYQFGCSPKIYLARNNTHWAMVGLYVSKILTN